MAKRILLDLVICFILYNQICAEEHNCVQENPCLCRFSDDKKIDLTPLAKQDFFRVNAGNLIYFYHVCEDADLESKECGTNVTSNTCTKASICVCDPNKHTVTKIASTAEGKFNDVTKENYVEKLVFTQENKIVATVILVCSEYSESILHSVNSTDYEKMILFSPHACPITETSGPSTGTVLLTIFFFVFLTYFVLGALLLRCLRGAHGLEMIPNLEFWRDLPFLVRDGAVFLFSGCKTAIPTSEAYDRI